jgi:hypothetical protein
MNDHGVYATIPPPEVVSRSQLQPTVNAGVSIKALGASVIV